MVRYLSIHPEAPQPRLLAQVAEILGAGGVAAIPTDSCYSLGCHLGDKDAVERIRQIRERAFEKLRESPDGNALAGFWGAA